MNIKINILIIIYLSNYLDLKDVIINEEHAGIMLLILVGKKTVLF